VEIKEAIESMGRILHEERLRPTTAYRDNLSDIKTGPNDSALLRMAAASLAYNRPQLTAMRAQSPRLVSDKPQLYSFGGRNYELLLILYGQLYEADRGTFIDKLLSFVECGGFCNSFEGDHFPKIVGYVSDLPMVAEFCIRNGYTERLFSAIGKAIVPTKALALLLMQLEEAIALNFTLFSRQDLKKLQVWLDPFRKTAELQTNSSIRERGKTGPSKANPLYRRGRERESRQIVRSIDGIEAESNQAIFFYIRDSLHQVRSADIENDRVKIEGYLAKLGFNPLLRQALEQAEKEFREDASGFELKTCLGHLRSFLEQLHAQACAAIAAGTTPATEYNKWGLTVMFLRKNGYLSPHEEKLVASIHAIMSADGVHPLIAQPEYARLLRNIVIEYGLLILTILDKKGVKIAA
jgi:hypothetical protein